MFQSSNYFSKLGVASPCRLLLFLVSHFRKDAKFTGLQIKLIHLKVRWLFINSVSMFHVWCSLLSSWTGSIVVLTEKEISLACMYINCMFFVFPVAVSLSRENKRTKKEPWSCQFASARYVLKWSNSNASCSYHFVKDILCNETSVELSDMHLLFYKSIGCFGH